MTTKKTKTSKTNTSTSARNRTRTRAPELPIGAIHEIADWMLDLAQRSADGDREDLAAIERVRRAAHAALDGRRYRTPTERDLLSVASLVVTAAERDLGVAGLSDAMATSFDVLSLRDEPVGLAPVPPMPPMPIVRRGPSPIVRAHTLPYHTCAHRGPLLAPSLRCVP
ncbi:MAG: hypothetical protein HS111_17015 [Kofleriaceae bacterium]|nr:hypothetical protein [Kofleriaceae bacterium]MCL4223129.1 hypothetical protein [Myxococcales bacterium]